MVKAGPAHSFLNPPGRKKKQSSAEQLCLRDFFIFAWPRRVLNVFFEMFTKVNLQVYSEAQKYEKE